MQSWSISWLALFDHKWDSLSGYINNASYSFAFKFEIIYIRLPHRWQCWLFCRLLWWILFSFYHIFSVLSVPRCLNYRDASSVLRIREDISDKLFIKMLGYSWVWPEPHPALRSRIMLHLIENSLKCTHAARCDHE